MSRSTFAQFRLSRRQWIAAAGLLEAGCSRGPAPAKAEIQFSRIPKADANGTEKHDIIEGSVTGAREGQQILLYSKSETWWLQPLPEAPFTRILAKGKWRNATHLGSEYAALLVDANHRAVQNLKTLPAVGGTVSAVKVVPGAERSPSQTIEFSGYEWRVRSAPSNRGGKPNPYSTDCAWVDAKGALHLAVKQKEDRFECAEIALTRSLGYGTYSFQVRDLSKLSPSIVLEMFTWDYSGTDQNNREMDIVIRKPGPIRPRTVRYIVQPYQVASNLFDFNLPDGPSMHSFQWRAGEIQFSTSLLEPRPKEIAQHDFRLGVPTPGVESARFALYLPNSATRKPEEGEVIIDRFEYKP